MQRDPSIIATISKNSQEEIRVSLSEFKGHRLVDVRTYADFDGQGERRATKKGISLKLEKLPDLIQALEAAAAQSGGGGNA